jgi:large subunit ribosomal protein L33
MAKGATKAGAILVKLVSAARTGFFYVKRKNPKKTPRKLEFVKYDPRVRRRRDGVATRTREPNARCLTTTARNAGRRARAGSTARAVHGDED